MNPHNDFDIYDKEITVARQEGREEVLRFLIAAIKRRREIATSQGVRDGLSAALAIIIRVYGKKDE